MLESEVLLQVLQKRALLLRKKGDATVPLLLQSLELAQNKTENRLFIYLFIHLLHRGIN